VGAVWWSSIQPPHHEAIKAAAHAAENKTIQDISAETVAYYMKMLAWFTGVLAVGVLFQIGLLFKADKTARLSADISEKQMLISGRQTDIQEKQHAVGRLQFFASHRPRLIVRGISFTEQDGLVAGKRLKIQIPIVNQGNTDAIVRTIAAKTFLVSRLERINVGGDFHTIDTSGLAPLSSGTNARVGILTDQAFGPEDIFGIQQKTRFLLCVGFVQYRDESGGLRATGFMRCLQHESGRFTPIDDPEYEFNY
jgi:hypothetical protein